jgi:hypothetical protein
MQPARIPQFSGDWRDCPCVLLVPLASLRAAQAEAYATGSGVGFEARVVRREEWGDSFRVIYGEEGWGL